MAQLWEPKAPTEIVERRWTVPVDDDDGLASFARSLSGVTLVSYEVQGNDAVVTLSAGSAGATAIVTLTATTSRGRVHVETFYLPIIAATNGLAYTGTDLASDILELVTGAGVAPPVDESNLVLRKASEMFAAWAVQGADLGVPLPVTTSSILYIEDAFMEGVKANLLLRVMTKFKEGWMPTPDEREAARRGLQAIKVARLSKDRGLEKFY